MPRIFEDPPTDSIAQLSLDDPITIPYIVLLLPLSYLLLRRRELRTTADTHCSRNVLSRKQMLKSLLIVPTSMYSLPVFTFFGKWLDLRWTAQTPCATYIHIAFFLEVGQLEVSEHGYAIVIRVVIVPLVTVGMDEEDVVGEGRVVVDYVAGYRQTEVSFASRSWGPKKVRT